MSGLRKAWDEFRSHSLWNHLVAPIWRHVPEKARWSVVTLMDKSRRYCWADLVSVALAHDEADACDTAVPNLRCDSERCASVCDWMRPDHAGEHECRCYCGKFTHRAPLGAIERAKS